MAAEKEIKEEEERKLSKVHMFVYFQLRTMPFAVCVEVLVVLIVPCVPVCACSFFKRSQNM